MSDPWKTDPLARKLPLGIAAKAKELGLTPGEAWCAHNMGVSFEAYKQQHAVKLAKAGEDEDVWAMKPGEDPWKKAMAMHTSSKDSGFLDLGLDGATILAAKALDLKPAEALAAKRMGVSMEDYKNERDRLKAAGFIP